MKRILGYILPLIVLGISVFITGLLFSDAQDDIHVKEQELIEGYSEEIIDAIRKRMDIYIAVHDAGVGLFNASDYVSGKEWRRFIQSLNVFDDYPGINGLGYAFHADYENVPDRLEAIRQKEDPKFDYYPKGVRDDYFITKFIEPIERNFEAYGFDMGVEPTRRRAMELARDTGQPTISGSVILVQDEDKTPGFLSYDPLYRGGVEPETVAERQKNFIGLVYAPFIAKKFFRPLWNSELKLIKELAHVEIYDGIQLIENKLLYRHSPRAHSAHNHNQLSFTKPITLYGTTWTIRILTCEPFFLELDHERPVIILIAGLVIGFMISTLVFVLMRIQQRAQSLANEMMQEANTYQKSLERSNAELEKIKSELEQKIQQRTKELSESRQNLEIEVSERTSELESKMSEFARMNKMMLGREKRMIELKQELTDLKKKLKEIEGRDA